MSRAQDGLVTRWQEGPRLLTSARPSRKPRANEPRQGLSGKPIRVNE
jgi:hypothetical protein